MAALPRNTNFELRNGLSENKRFECFQVKLTDSAWASLKTAAQSQNAATLNLTVRNNEGTLEIPHGAGDQQEWSPYRFRLSPFSMDTSSRLECINFPKSSRMSAHDASSVQSMVRSLGKVTRKLQILANDDVFSATRKKISDVEREKEKHSTVTIHGPNATESVSFMRVQARQKKESRLKGKTTATNSSTNGRVSGPSLKEKIIHLLAFSSYKMADLLIRLHQLENPNHDGNMSTVPSRPQPGVQMVLDQVARLDRHEKYRLHLEQYQEVNDAWPWYKAEESARVKDRKREALEHLATSTTKQQSTKKKDSRSPTPQTNNSLMETMNGDSVSPTAPPVTSGISRQESIVAGMRTSTGISRAPLAPQSYARKVEALDLLADGQTITHVALNMRLSQDMLAKWQAEEMNIRKQAEVRGIHGRHSVEARRLVLEPLVEPPPPPPPPPPPAPVAAPPAATVAPTVIGQSESITKPTIISSKPTPCPPIVMKVEPKIEMSISPVKSMPSSQPYNNNKNNSNYEMKSVAPPAPSRSSKLSSNNAKKNVPSANESSGGVDVKPSSATNNCTPVEAMEVTRNESVGSGSSHSSEKENKTLPRPQAKKHPRQTPQEHAGNPVAEEDKPLSSPTIAKRARKTLNNPPAEPEKPTPEPQALATESLAKEFPFVESVAEHRVYCDTFNRDYPEYLRDFEDINRKSECLNELDTRLRNCASLDGEEYRNLERQVRQIYEEVMQPSYQSMIQRVLYLHTKLTHLKSRIREYASRRLARRHAALESTVKSNNNNNNNNNWSSRPPSLPPTSRHSTGSSVPTAAVLS